MKRILEDSIDLDLWLKNFAFDTELQFKVTANPLPTSNLMVKCEKDLTSREVIQNWISKRFAMTFKIDPETWFRVTANTIHLPQNTPYVK